MHPNKRIDDAFEKAGASSEAFMKFIARSWRPIAGGAIALLLLSIGMIFISLYRPFSGRGALSSVSEVEASSAGFYRALDGVEVADASSTRLFPFGVMVENSADAWPLTGVASANVVFEAPVEGSITRLLLLFDPETASGDIGPVRSARPYYVEIADAFNALYAHVGGSPDALKKIAALNDFKDLDQFYHDRYFWRSAARTAPHNVLTTTERLTDAAAKKEWTADAAFTPWRYEDAAPAEMASAAEIRVPYDGIYAASWVYDAASGLYARLQNGHPQKDADGTPVMAENVVVLATDATVLDDIGRLKLRTTGSGKAIVASGGEVFEGRWERRSGENFRFIAADGADIPLRRGKTWVSLVTTDLNGVLNEIEN